MEISLTSSARRRAWHDVRVLYFQFLVVAAVFGAIAWVAAGRGGGLADPRQDRPEPALAEDRQLGRDDIDSARFAVAVRGYRMDQVDRLLDRLAFEIEQRDRLIADLTQPAGGARFGEGVSYEPVERAQAQEEAASPVVAPAAPEGPGRDQESAEDKPLSAWYRDPDQEQ
jgi:DivIVA domain-containing protein